MSYEITKSGYKVNPEITNSEDGYNYWNRKRIRASLVYQYYVYRWAEKIIIQANLSNVVDVGCGPATKLMKVFGDKNLSLIGIDQKSAIEFCQSAHSKGLFVVDDFNKPSFEINHDNKLFICCDVIEHVSRPDKLLTYLNEKMGEGCLLLISTPERDKLRGKNNLRPTNPAHIREWNSDEFGEFLLKHGFEIVERKVLYPVKFSLNIFNIIHILKQTVKMRSFFTNQAVLVRKR